MAPPLNWPAVDADHLLVTAAQMQALEDALFRSGLPQAALMEKVGLAMAERLLHRPDWLGDGVVVLVGPGHNGGDGLVVARTLQAAAVPVHIWTPLPIRRELTAAHLRHLQWLGVPSLSEPPDPAGAALWIDALFGLGQTRPLPEELAELFDRREALQPRRLVSLDVPSGICSDRGCPLEGRAAKAALTLCVGLWKRGLRLDPALDHVGRVERIDLGLAKHQIRTLPPDQPMRCNRCDLDDLPLPRLPRNAMKYQRGRVLVVAGSQRYRGAAALALQGALASGCGSVQAQVPRGLTDALGLTMPELICLDGSEPPPLDRLDALLFGPGLGQNPDQWRCWSVSLQRFRGLLVLDADGINGLASTPQSREWLLARAGPTWLTPHLAEFQRLFGDITDGDVVEACRAAARDCGCSVLLKGAHSVVAADRGRPLLLDGTSPHVARTGLGDVLAGFVTGWGAIARAGGYPLDHESLAAAALMHAIAAAESPSTRASAVAETLEKSMLKRLKSS